MYDQVLQSHGKTTALISHRSQIGLQAKVKVLQYKTSQTEEFRGNLMKLVNTVDRESGILISSSDPAISEEANSKWNNV